MSREIRKGEAEKRKREDLARRSKSSLLLFSLSPFLLICIFFTACSQLEKPRTEPFYAETAPPQKKEFRWSNGKMPKSFDPAKASAPPETDVVRAVFEGLTDIDSKTLQPVPAIAIEWNASEDYKTWTFKLRQDAIWSNGEQVTAKDFVRSWKRLAALGDKTAHRELLRNIVGLQSAETKLPLPNETEDSEIFSGQSLNQNEPQTETTLNSNSAVPLPSPTAPPISGSETRTGQNPVTEKPSESPLGVEAVDNYTLKVLLVSSDENFAALIAHPIFRPIYGDGKNFETGELNADIVTNGAFRIFSVGQDGITLDRAEKYWNRQSVELERVRFVPTENAEKALEAYRNGEVDAVTNADFEPLALKLLAPFEDFRRTTFSAINFYEFNRKKAPFDDRRVREALTIAIERERITEDDMAGASNPALGFMPFEKTGEPDEKPGEKKFAQDRQKAKTLLAESGFPEGENFPVVKLLVNRNNVQQRVARSVAKMWKQNLNVETEIVVKDSAEINAAWETEEFTLLRRGVVLPTANESANMRAIFAPPIKPRNASAENNNSGQNTSQSQTNQNLNSGSPVSSPEKPTAESEMQAGTIEEILNPAAIDELEMILTEEQAISELRAIPLYFPTSYSLVKPYIQGFNINIFDAPSLKDVKIDNNWQPKTPKKES